MIPIKLNRTENEKGFRDPRPRFPRNPIPKAIPTLILHRERAVFQEEWDKLWKPRRDTSLGFFRSPKRGGQDNAGFHLQARSIKGRKAPK